MVAIGQQEATAITRPPNPFPTSEANLGMQTKPLIAAFSTNFSQRTL